MKYLKHLLFTFVFCVFSSPFVSALTIKPLTFEQLVAVSDKIVEVTPEEESKIADDVDESGYLVKYTTFRVHRVFKGDVGSTLTIKQLAQFSEEGGDVSSRSPIGLPDYKVGEKVLLFLSEESPNTFLTAPIGVTYGLFKPKKVGGKTILPSLKFKKTLFKNLQKQVPGKVLTTNELKLGSKNYDYETFILLIQKFVEEK